MAGLPVQPAAAILRRNTVAAHAQSAVWQLPNERVILMSGGSAWADHVAVKLFVDQAMDPEGAPYAGLYLFLPCELSSAGAAGRGVRFADTGSVDWRSNPGRLLNQLHAAFTLNDLAVARAFGAKLSFEGRGFHQRNKLVAGQADRMLAYTWGSDRAQPKDGGTMHTWKLVLPRAVKMHVPLADLMSGAIATAENPTSWSLRGPTAGAVDR